MIDPRLDFFGDVGEVRKAQFLAILQGTRIELVSDPSIAERYDVEVAATRAADLLARLFDHVTIKMDVPWALAANQRNSTLRPTAAVVPDNTVTAGFGDVGADVHIGYTLGNARVSLSEPLPCEREALAALLAGPVCAAEIFKLVFEPFIPEIIRENYTIPIGLTDSCEMRLLEHEANVDLVIGGGGSVGFALVDALVRLRFRLRGRVVIADNGILEARNVYKYPWLDKRTAESGASKVEVLAARLENAFPDLMVEVHPEAIASYQGAPGQIAIVSMDNIPARRAAQELLSRDIVNIAVEGTRLEVASLKFGETGCIYCYYRNNREEAQDYRQIAERLGLTVERVAQLMINNDSLTDDDVSKIEQNLDCQNRYIRDFVDQPLRTLLPRLPYSQAVVRTPAGELRVTTAFVSAMAGTIGALELLKLTAGLRSTRRSVALDMVGIFHAGNIIKIGPFADCSICSCKFRKAEYSRLWLDSVCA